MKIKVVLYNENDQEFETLFESEVHYVPKKNEAMSFYLPDERFCGNPLWAKVRRVTHCFNKNNEFTHIEVELKQF